MSEEGVSWDIRFPLLTNRYFMLDLVKVYVVTMGIFVLLIGVITKDLGQTMEFTGITGASWASS